MKPYGPTKRHHYVPAMYLKQWLGADGKLCEYRRVNQGKVVTSRKSENATGFKYDLYKIDGVPPLDAQAIEMQFMRFIDQDAHKALEHIKNNPNQPFPGRLRSAWVQFLISFIFRNPEAVTEIKRHIVNMWKEGIAALEDEYKALKKPGEPETLTETIHPAAAQVGFANFFTGLINKTRAGPDIHDMHFGRIVLHKANHTLLTSDRPLHMPAGLGDPDAYISLPVTPRILFIAARKPDFVPKLARMNHDTIVRNVNERTVRTAQEYVWGLSDSQLVYVQRNIASVPQRQLITDEQRLSAVAAAKGESVEILRQKMSGGAPAAARKRLRPAKIP